MPLERLVEEIRLRAQTDLEGARSRLEEEQKKIVAERDRRVQELRAEGERLTALEGVRLRAQHVAAAKLKARKLQYEAEERQSSAGLELTRQMLAGFTKGSEYASVLKRMYALAVDQLGKQIRVSGRSEDAGALKSIAGKAFDDTPLPILGGLVATSADGSRRLNLTLDELLRLREDKVRDLLRS